MTPMTRCFISPSPHRRLLALAALLLALGAIFAADTLTDYGVAAALFYTVVILFAVRLLTRAGMLLLAGACIALIVLSFQLSSAGAYRVGVINSVISIVVVGVTTSIAVQMEHAKAAAHAAQAQLLRLARARSLGGLTASIAHEVNQPLAAIVTSGNACQRWLGQQPPNLERAQAALQRILDDANRASEVIARIRSLSKGETPRKSAFDLNAAVLEVLALSRSELERNAIALRVELAPALPPVLADRVQTQQVLVNLVLNAMEAMAQTPAAARTIRIGTEPEDARSLRLTVEDGGVGLSAEAQAHLFDAFWTTKPDGIGIGLSISRSIVEASGGRIWAAPRSPCGAVFGVCLPIATPGARQ
ncbi:two-component sensor histidine kinase [Xanthomonas cerealis pv. cerealis]|uniref:histidine kinase n=2 Tax=Xanthomonas translucens group TaxID=3390202 RepID=A0A514EGP3_9XANT|nr:ATP-binding protein [Xanthomonas translucens]QDI05217.1 two-component sensor histidine kinase [Xanthomonas translucens pv. cerealis]UKE69605.1 two-component sensor histidine kinase [Xanthomonas translucens pv. pistacia]